MADLMLYTVAVLSIAGLLVLGLHREKLRAAASRAAWLPAERWLAAVDPAACGEPSAATEAVIWRGFSPDLVLVDELEGRSHPSPAMVDAVDRAVRDLAEASAIPASVFLESSVLAQFAEFLAPGRVTRPSVFETHPTSPQAGDVAYGTVPEGCWKTVEAGEGYWPCNAAVEDVEVGLCPAHCAELRSAS